MTERNLTPFGWGKGKKGEMSPLEDLQSRINSMFDDVWKGFDLTPFRPFGESLGEISPRVDVKETDKQFKFTVELPGMEEKDVEVTLTDNRLTIKGEKKAEKEEKDENRHLVERSYGSFQRSFSLPGDVESGKTKADFSKGVLTVTVPKSAKAKSAVKKVAIKSGD
jgi:HSP20 family protein